MKKILILVVLLFSIIVHAQIPGTLIISHYENNVCVGKTVTITGYLALNSDNSRCFGIPWSTCRGYDFTITPSTSISFVEGAGGGKHFTINVTSAVAGTINYNLKISNYPDIGNGFPAGSETTGTTFSITFVNQLPANAGTISGNTTVCQSQNNVVYTVPLVSNATSYTWTLPTGATGSSTTNSISVNYGANAVSGNITVRASNACGVSNLSTLPITVNSLPGAPSGITGTNIVCPGQNLTYTVPLITGSTSYVWTLPTGATGTSTTNSISVNYGANAVSGNITVRASNACGVSNLSTLPITVNSLPNTPSAISGTNNVCPGQNLTYTVPLITGATSYVWTLPTGATGTSATNSITVNYSSAAVASNISVQGKNSCGLGPISSFPIQFLLCSPNIKYTAQNTHTIGSVIVPIVPTNTGGLVLGNYSVTPKLPYGLTFDPVTGTISGIPTLATPATKYTVTSANSAGSNTATLTVAIINLLPPSITYNSPQSYTIGTAINPLAPINSGGIVPSTPSPLVTTYAGSVNPTTLSINGTIDQATFNMLGDLIVDPADNIYISEYDYGGVVKIRKITSLGVVSTFVDSGIFGMVNGFAFDAVGNVYVTDMGDMKIKKINPSGVVSIFAGDGIYGSVNGFKFLSGGIAVDAVGNVYVADAGNHKIIKINPSGVFSTFAGSGTAGLTDGIGTAASFNKPYGLAFDKLQNLYVADFGNGIIRKITPEGAVSTFAGNGVGVGVDGSAASFRYPDKLKLDDFGNLYVVEQGTAGIISAKIRKITPAGVVSTFFAGSGKTSQTDGTGTSASFKDFRGMAFDSKGNLYVTDSPNLIRKISITGYTITPNLPAGLTIDATTGIISGKPTVASPATTYTITAHNYSGSSKTTIVISTSTLGVDDFSKNSIKLFPNPTHSILNLSVNEGIIIDKVNIVDITGKVIVTQTKNLSTINVEQLAKGVYILSAYAGDKKYQEKFIKE